ncbi:response regulator [Dyadobacter sp. CY327]|uniref:response regulator n=1 Tax=Dyadobacter sp. CY327 TaxID=2907301 RepID=UPI001F2D723F|nr:response regulator [Dyadobacter sp. CY327]MCE7070568.1 response regulator [Dyadobacter sp. CY327]
MNKDGDIIIIEDDQDDQLLIEQAFQELGYTNKRIYFPDGLEALTYLDGQTPLPFVILSDINLPKLDGLELRRRLKENASLNLKCIPYLYFTTAFNQDVVIEAYSTSAQGFFVKPSDFNEIKETLKSIVEYWKRCASPNSF